MIWINPILISSKRFLLGIHKSLYQIYLFNRRVILFIIIGFFCYSIGLGQLILLVEGLNLEVNLANIIASSITILICYLLNVKFVFKWGRYSNSKEIFTFYIFSFVGLLLNITLMFLITKYLPICTWFPKPLLLWLLPHLILFPKKVCFYSMKWT